MSIISFPSVIENKNINEGYKGHDEFAIVETSLVQRFPIFYGTAKTGKTRQISYKLVNGEAIRRFKISNVTEF